RVKLPETFWTTVRYPCLVKPIRIEQPGPPQPFEIWNGMRANFSTSAAWTGLDDGLETVALTLGDPDRVTAGMLLTFTVGWFTTFTFCGPEDGPALPLVRPCAFAVAPTVRTTKIAVTAADLTLTICIIPLLPLLA